MTLSHAINNLRSLKAYIAQPLSSRLGSRRLDKEQQSRKDYNIILPNLKTGNKAAKEDIIQLTMFTKLGKMACPRLWSRKASMEIPG